MVSGGGTIVPLFCFMQIGFERMIRLIHYSLSLRIIRYFCFMRNREIRAKFSKASADVGWPIVSGFFFGAK